MKKIIHLSDIHIGYDDLTDRLDDIIARLIFTKKPPENYVIVITGDMVNDATKEDNYKKAALYLNRLKEAGFPVLIIPGNHDYGTGSRGSAEYVSKFKKTFYGTSAITYPKLDIIDNIAFIGLDSMAEELHWYDRLWAEGELGEQQLKRLAELLKSDKVKAAEYLVVYLHHHPFHPRPFHQLKDTEKLKEALAGHKIDALLFGHNHEGKTWNGVWGIKRVYDGGSSTGKQGKFGPHRVIDLSQEPVFDYDAQF